MSKLNKKTMARDSRIEKDVRVAGGLGAPAAKQDAEALLRRAVMASLLWEDFAYESGTDNAVNIANLVPQVQPEIVANIAREARLKQKLRHIPLYLAREMAKHKDHNKYLGNLLPDIITRADQITDFVALYWKEKRQPLTRQVRNGLAKCFHKFDEYNFAKYDRDGPVKLRDVMFMVHPKPVDSEQEALFKRIADRALKTPDTWEVALSTGSNKKETFTRLIEENKLGALALFRNLRGMQEADVPHKVIANAIKNASSQVLLPLNYYSAQKHAPDFTREIEDAMYKAYKNVAKLPGHTVFVVDVSGSMFAPVSSKSEYTRLDVAATLAMFASETCEQISVFATGTDTVKIKPLRGFSLVESIKNASNEAGGGGIYTCRCLDYIKENLSDKKPDRIIIFSDSQDCESSYRVPAPHGVRNYIVDVSAHKHGINYKGVWTAEISGWSENFLTYIRAFEGLENIDSEN